MSRIRNITTALAAVLLTAPAFAYDIQMAGNDTKLSVYGFIYSLNELYTNGASEHNMDYLSQPSFGNVLNQSIPPSGQLVMSISASRFGWATTTPTSAWGDITTKLEFDLNGLTAGTAFHFRHAFIGIGNWTFGHTYTNWIDLDALADEVDWQGLVATPGYDTPRRPQIRYTFPIDKNNKLAVSIEQNNGMDGDIWDTRKTAFYSGAVAVGPAGYYGQTLNTATQGNKLPSAVAAYTFSDSWGHLGLRVLGVDHSAYVPATNGVGDKKWDKWSTAGMVSGDVKFGKDDLVASFYMGKGLGSYGIGEQAAIYTNVAGGATDVLLYKNTGFTVGYTHVFSPEWRGNLVVSGVNFKSDSAIPTTNDSNTAGGAAPTLAAPIGTDLKSRYNYVANMFYTVNKNTQFGLEYFYEVSKTFGSNTVLKNDGTWDNKATSGRIEFLVKANF